jgi:hypothetical protein
VRELQIDCDWTDLTRAAFFDFVTELRVLVHREGALLSATIRLHQVKYRERTGVPPVDRGMLMFYNMGGITADADTRSIFDRARAESYLARLPEYPLPLDAALPIWSWTVHTRGDRVVGLLQSTDPAELVDPTYASSPRPSAAPGQTAWQDPVFVGRLIARVAKPATAFDRFLIAGSGYTQPGLERELALAYLVAGDFAAADKVFKTTSALSDGLGTDPFVIHIRDCHDCDQAKYRDAPWTHASFVARLLELQKAAKGNGGKAARAAFLLGNGLYNMTFYGNARSVFAWTHQATVDTRPAERWYKLAFELAVDRELKAQAAFMAAKAELAQLLESGDPKVETLADGQPVPRRWFPVVRELSDT